MENKISLLQLILAGGQTFLMIIYKQTPQYLTLYRAENPH